MTEKKQSLDGKRLNAFGMDPWKLVIVGLDVIVPADHELYQLMDEDRVTKPLEEATVDDMMESGVDLDIVIRKYKFVKGTVVWGEPLAEDTELPVVVDGRRRTQHSREANRRLKERKDFPILVPVKQWKGTIEEASDRSVVLNEHREEDPVLTKARKAKRMLARVKDEAFVAKKFKVGVPQIREWLGLLESPTLVQAVEKKDLPATSAIILAKLPPDHQKTELADAVAKGETSKKHIVGRVRRKLAESKGVKKNELPGAAPDRRTLRRIHTFISENNSDLVDKIESIEQTTAAVLLYVLEGNTSGSKLIAHCLKKLKDEKSGDKNDKSPAKTGGKKGRLAVAETA